MINEVFLKALLYTKRKVFPNTMFISFGFNGLIQMGWVKRGMKKVCNLIFNEV